MVALFLTRGRLRKWLKQKVEQALLELPAQWSLTPEGQLVLSHVEFASFDDDSSTNFRLDFADPLRNRVDLQSEITKYVRKTILKEFEDSVVTSHQEKLQSVIVRTVESLRSIDVAGLAYTSHQMHRRALFDQLKSVTIEEFKEFIHAELKKMIVMSAESQQKKTALTSEELVPQNLRFAFTKGGRRFFIIQEPPRLRTVRIASLKGVAQYQLATPYVTYVIALSGSKYDQARICFQSAPLRSLNERIFAPCLPNLLNELQICMDTKPFSELNTPYEVCEAVINQFWSADFVTTDRNHNGTYTHDRWGGETFKNDKATVKSFDHWHQQTQKLGVEFALKAKWMILENTVQDLVMLTLKHQAKDAPENDRLEAYIRQTAEAIARKLQVRLIKEVPQLPLDDAMKQKLRDNAQELAGVCETEITGILKKFKVDKSNAPITPLAMEVLVKRVMREGVRTATAIQKLNAEEY